MQLLEQAGAPPQEMALTATPHFSTITYFSQSGERVYLLGARRYQSKSTMNVSTSSDPLNQAMKVELGAVDNTKAGQHSAQATNGTAGDGAASAGCASQGSEAGVGGSAGGTCATAPKPSHETVKTRKKGISVRDKRFRAPSLCF